MTFSSLTQHVASSV